MNKNVFEIETYFIEKFDSIRNGLNTTIPYSKKKTYEQKPQPIIYPHCNIRFSQDIYLQNHINQFHNH